MKNRFTSNLPENGVIKKQKERAEKFLPVAFILLGVTVLLASWFLWVLQKEQVQTVTNWNVAIPPGTYVKQLPNSPYNCKTLKAVVGQDLEYCVLGVKRPMEPNVNTVMGDYSQFRIRVTQETRNDSILHELGHYLSACLRTSKDEELCVRSFQKYALELNLVK